MENETTHDQTALDSAYETAFSNYRIVQELVAELRDLPKSAKKSIPCEGCAKRLTLNIAMLLRQISKTSYDKLLDEYASYIDQEFVAEAVPSESASESVH